MDLGRWPPVRVRGPELGDMWFTALQAITRCVDRAGGLTLVRCHSGIPHPGADRRPGDVVRDRGRRGPRPVRGDHRHTPCSPRSRRAAPPRSVRRVRARTSTTVQSDLHLEGPLDPTLLRRSMEALVERHEESARTVRVRRSRPARARSSCAGPSCPGSMSTSQASAAVSNTRNSLGSSVRISPAGSTSASTLSSGADADHALGAATPAVADQPPCDPRRLVGSRRAPRALRDYAAHADARALPPATPYRVSSPGR